MVPEVELLQSERPVDFRPRLVAALRAKGIKEEWVAAATHWKGAGAKQLLSDLQVWEVKQPLNRTP